MSLLLNLLASAIWAGKQSSDGREECGYLQSCEQQSQHLSFRVAIGIGIGIGIGVSDVDLNSQ